MDNKVVNREDMVGIVAENTGYTQESVRRILEAEGEAKLELLKQGYTYKDWFIGRFDLVKRTAKKNAYDGINKRRYVVPEKYVLVYKPLIRSEEALAILNNTIDK